MTTINSTHLSYMAIALRLAERGRYTCQPNPRVGCVIVKDGKVVGEGAHLTAGQGHAEVNALAMAGEHAEGSDVYVSLEPCFHTGRTPPCAQALIAAKVRAVFIAMLDPNPKVAGKGAQQLRDAGIIVHTDLLAADAIQLNPGFVQRMTKAKPMVRLKTASTLDGKIAAADGTSQWITGLEARGDVQHQRAMSSAILTSVNTVIADDPSLTVRGEAFQQQARLSPLLRIVLDSQLRIPKDAKLLHDNAGPVLIYTTKPAPVADYGKQTEVVRVPAADEGHVDLHAVLADLASREVNDLLVECGSILASAWLNANLVDEVIAYISPDYLGDDAKGVVRFPQENTLSQRHRFAIKSCRIVGDNIRLILAPKVNA